MQRIQEALILKDLDKKMVLLVGPRQVGKSYLARKVAAHFLKAVYLNYDQIQDRLIIKAQSWLPTTDLLILDELHKMPDWKNYLKGVFDTKADSMKLLITGSARLDAYDHLGDSLAGRYFRHRLLPFSLSELNQVHVPCDFTHLLERSGFPEPYLSESTLDAARWRAQYINSLLATDVFEFEKIRNIKAMQLVFQLLRKRVGSPVSYSSLSEDVGVSPATIKQYIQILEALFIVFTVSPYSKNIARSLLKESKIYFFDTGLVEDSGAKLENMVAVSLLKHVYAKIDYEAQEYALHYLRTKEGHEVDFALALKDTVTQIIEVQTSEDKPSKSLLYFHQKYEYPAVQLVQMLRNEYQLGGVTIRKAEEYLKELAL